MKRAIKACRGCRYAFGNPMPLRVMSRFLNYKEEFGCRFVEKYSTVTDVYYEQQDVPQECPRVLEHTVLGQGEVKECQSEK